MTKPGISSQISYGSRRRTKGDIFDKQGYLVAVENGLQLRRPRMLRVGRLPAADNKPIWYCQRCPCILSYQSKSASSPSVIPQLLEALCQASPVDVDPELYLYLANAAFSAVSGHGSSLPSSQSEYSPLIDHYFLTVFSLRESMNANDKTDVWNRNIRLTSRPLISL
jgi:hypothetical protein